MSFKEGEGEANVDGRFTALMSAKGLELLLARHPRLVSLRVWTTRDAEGRSLCWINTLARRGSG